MHSKHTQHRARNALNIYQVYVLTPNINNISSQLFFMSLSSFVRSHVNIDARFSL